jgi:hypothetical protein
MEDQDKKKGTPRLKVRKYNDIIYVKITNRLFLQDKKAKELNEKAPDYKNGNSAAWFATGDTWQGLDASLEVDVESLIEFLKAEGLV